MFGRKHIDENVVGDDVPAIGFRIAIPAWSWGFPKPDDKDGAAVSQQEIRALFGDDLREFAANGKGRKRARCA